MLRSLLAELKADVGSSKLPASLTVGPLLGILLVVPMSSFALVVFSGPLASVDVLESPFAHQRRLYDELSS